MNAISISSVKAIEVEDEKEDNQIYVYFEYPQMRGEEIVFRINYFKDNNDKYEDISIPLILSKSSISISFRILTV